MTPPTTKFKHHLNFPATREHLLVVAGESVVVEGPESSEKSLSAAESLGAEPLKRNSLSSS